MRDNQPPSLHGTETNDHDGESGRLPTVVVPLHYELQLEPDVDEATFSGSVIIDVNVLQTTSQIVLHSLELDIEQAMIRTKNGDGAWNTVTITNQPDDQTITLSSDNHFEQGEQYQLCVKFNGSLADKLAGFYRGSYKTKDGATEYYAVTQMQPCDARRAFPCFDEPALKATFSVSLVAPEGLTCLSNMDVREAVRREADAKNVFHYNTTPRMSTYLVAVAVGKFDYVENSTFHVPIRVYSTPDHDVHIEGRYAVDLTAKALTFYEETFGAKYPLPKLDLIGVSAQMGAMENWGCVIFIDKVLLERKDSTSAAAKEQLANCVLHEEAHQWFGNLVTMEWWEGLWLNESFADWVSILAVDIFNPTWQSWDKFVSDPLQEALMLDSLINSHPIEVHVKSAAEASSVFDAISYQKGASVLRMLATYLTVPTFVDGVRRYIDAHKYGSTKTADLWEQLSKASGQDIASLLQPWTKNTGHPVLTVTEDPRTNTITIQQNRYLRSGTARPADDKVLWPIFLEAQTSLENQNTTRHLLTARRSQLQLPDLTFYKLNSNHTGVYRTLYPAHRLMILGAAAQRCDLSVSDRIGLAADSISLSISGHQPSTTTFNFLQTLRDDPSFFVWKQTTSWFTALTAAWNFEPEPVRAALAAAQREFTAPKAHSLGWTFGEKGDGDAKEDDDSSAILTAKFKSLLFTSAGFAGDQDIVSAAQTMFSSFASGDRSALSPNLRLPVFALAIRHGTPHTYDQLLHIYRQSTRTDERADALSGLGYATSPSLIEQNVAMFFDPSVRFVDLPRLGGAMRMHRGGAEALLEVLLERWEELAKRVPPGLGFLAVVTVGMIRGLTTEAQAAAVEAAFERRKVLEIEREVRQAIEEVRVRAGWVSRSKREVEGWLRDKGFLGEDDMQGG